MRFVFQVVASFILLYTCAFAAEIQVKVIDPNSAPVLGAEVDLLGGDDQSPSVGSTSAAGLCTFEVSGDGSYRVRVLAPGFAPYKSETVSLPSFPLTVRLQLAPATETVMVPPRRPPRLQPRAREWQLRK